jgi:hypothetical protein
MSKQAEMTNDQLEGIPAALKAHGSLLIWLDKYMNWHSSASGRVQPEVQGVSDSVLGASKNPAKSGMMLTPRT